MCGVFNREILDCIDKSIITLLGGIKHNIKVRIVTQKDVLGRYKSIISPKTQIKRETEWWSTTSYFDDDFVIYLVFDGVRDMCC